MSTQAAAVTDLTNAVVTQRIEVSPGLAILRVVPDGWQLPDFSPGQFAVLGLPGAAPRYPGSDVEEAERVPDKLIKRAYSIASSSVSQEYMEFYVALVPSGALTPRLFELGAGDRVWLSQKATGLFTLDQVPGDKHVMLVSTGTGLAPYVSMLRSQLVCGGPRHFAVLHGARHSWDLGYRSELRMLERMCPNFTYLPSISRPDEEHVGWTGKTGYVQDLWTAPDLTERLGFEPTPETTHVFLCGNPSMVETMASLAAERGWTEHSKKVPGNLHLERYW